MPDEEILATPARGIGDNNPPLSELLVDETANLKQRADDLVAGAGRCVVTDEDTAKRATQIAGMMKDHAVRIEAAREERKRPFLEGGRTVDAHFAALKAPLVGNDPKGKLGGAAAEVIAKIDAYRREEDRKAEAERRRLEEVARKAREAQAAAERAQREAEEASRRAAEEAAAKIRAAEEAARKAGDREAAEKARRERAEADAARQRQESAERQKRLDAEIAAGKERDRIAAIERQAAASVAKPIDSGYGPKAFGRKVTTVTITDLTAAIRHARKLNEAPIRDAVQAIYDKQARAGVRMLPGATVDEDTSTQIRKGA